jgi:uncharacterized protein (TIGR00369 family)
MNENPTFTTETLHQIVPFAGTLGIVVDDATPAAVSLRLAWRPALCTAAGVLHGGALMSLADTAGAIAATLNLPAGATGTTTVESKTNLLTAAREGDVGAVAVPLHTGRSLIVIETELRIGERLISKTIQTQAVLS